MRGRRDVWWEWGGGMSVGGGGGPENSSRRNPESLLSLLSYYTDLYFLSFSILSYPGSATLTGPNNCCHWCKACQHPFRMPDPGQESKLHRITLLPFPPQPTPHLLCLLCRKISLIEGKAKWRHLKQFTCKGSLRKVFSWIYRMESVSQVLYIEGHFVILDLAFSQVHLSPLSTIHCANYNPVHTYTVQHSTVYKMEGGGWYGVLSRKVPWKGNYYIWWHFALPSMSLVFLRCRQGEGGGRWAMGGWEEWRLENKETPILALPDLEQRTCLPFKQNYL